MGTRVGRFGAVVLLAFAVSGAMACTDRLAPTKRCTVNGECLATEVCASGACVERPGREPDPTPEPNPTPEGDAGAEPDPIDGGPNEPDPTPDPIDAGHLDAGPTDAGPNEVDAGPTDAGPIDAGPDPVDLGPEIDAPPIGMTFVLEGTMDADSPTWLRPNEDCSTNVANNGPQYVQGHLLRNPTAATITLTVTGNWAVGTDGYLLIYETPFNAITPLIRCRAGDDDFNGFRSSQVSKFQVPPGATVVVIASSYAAIPVGNYTLEVSGTSAADLPDVVPVLNSAQTIHTEGVLHPTDAVFDFLAPGCNADGSTATTPYQAFFLDNSTGVNFTLTLDGIFPDGPGAIRVFYETAAPTQPGPVPGYDCIATADVNAGQDVRVNDLILNGERLMFVATPSTPTGTLGRFDLDFTFVQQ